MVVEWVVVVAVEAKEEIFNINYNNHGENRLNMEFTLKEKNIGFKEASEKINELKEIN